MEDEDEGTNFVDDNHGMEVQHVIYVIPFLMSPYTRKNIQVHTSNEF